MSNNYSEQDIRRIAADELRKLLAKYFGGLFNASSHDIEWLTTAEAVERLNYPSADSLRKDIAKAGTDGNLRLGIEVQDRRKRGSKKPDYYFNYNKCIDRLNVLPEKRSA